MKRLSIALALSLLSATAAFAAPAEKERCNAAQQNWMNGSGTTCAITDQNNEQNNYRQLREALR